MGVEQPTNPDRREFLKRLSAVSFAAFVAEFPMSESKAEAFVPTQEEFDERLADVSFQSQLPEEHTKKEAEAEHETHEEWRKSISQHFAESDDSIKYLLFRYLDCYGGKEPYITEYNGPHDFKRICE